MTTDPTTAPSSCELPFADQWRGFSPLMRTRIPFVTKGADGLILRSWPWLLHRARTAESPRSGAAPGQFVSDYSRKSESSEMCCTSSSRTKLACNPHCPHPGKSSSLRIHNSEGFLHPLCSGRQIPESGTVSPLRKATCWALPVLCCVTFESPLQNETFIFTTGNNANPLPSSGIEKIENRGFRAADTRNFFRQKVAFSTSGAQVARYLFNMPPGISGGAIKQIKIELNTGNQNRQAGGQRQPGQSPNPSQHCNETADGGERQHDQHSSDAGGV